MRASCPKCRDGSAEARQGRALFYEEPVAGAHPHRIGIDALIMTCDTCDFRVAGYGVAWPGSTVAEFIYDPGLVPAQQRVQEQHHLHRQEHPEQEPGD